MRPVPVLLLLAAAGIALPAAAETYKWVDERGVINYSNTPPANVKAAKPLPASAERVSVIPSDEVTKAVSAYRGPSYYEQQLEREWAQRQRLMAAEKAQTTAPCTPYDYFSCAQDDRLSSYYPYPVPIFAARAVRPTRLIATPVNLNPPSKARLMQLQR
ncbi:MAG: DUF4124 domain-containing protein [Clostridia bacterium]